MAIGIAIMASYVFGFYSLLDMKYVTLQVTDPVRNESRWVSHLSTFYKDNKVVILILYNHLLSLTIPCASLVVVIVTTSITINRLRTTMAWRLETANKASSGQRSWLLMNWLLTSCQPHGVSPRPASTVFIPHTFKSLLLSETLQQTCAALK